MSASRRSSMLAAAAAAVLVAAAAAKPGQAQGSMPDSAQIVLTVERFHSLIAAGDSLAALALLSDDAIILESGGVETKAEFREHHLAADIEFARSTKSSRRITSVARRGDVAWVVSTSTATGTFRGRPIDSSGAELMVLVASRDGWRVSAIHWSSRTRRP